MAETCAECGFDWGLPGSDACVALRSFARRYKAPFTRFLPDEDGAVLVRDHPIEGMWSALEYAGHVDAVFVLSHERIQQVLVHDRPTILPVDPEAVVRDGHLNESDPSVVAESIAANAEALAAALDHIDLASWGRVGVRDGDELSVLWLAVNAVHEGSHHLLDIGRVMRAARERLGKKS